MKGGVSEPASEPTGPMLFKRPTPTLARDELASSVLLGDLPCHTVMRHTIGMSGYSPVGVKSC